MTTTYPTLATAAQHLRALVKQSLLSAGETPIEASLTATRAGERGCSLPVEVLCATDGKGFLRDFDSAARNLCAIPDAVALHYRADFGPVAGIVRLSVTVSPEPTT